MCTGQTTGFFGKIVNQGDFIARHLPSDFVAAWDKWLQACMQASRDRLGHAWLDFYLTSPLWHFFIREGVLNDAAWTGVIMPSMDRVGRYYPLTIATIAESGDVALALERRSIWHAQVERLALSTLNGTVTPEKLMASLLQMSSAETTGIIRHSHIKKRFHHYLPIGGAQFVVQELTLAAPTRTKWVNDAGSFWWSDGSERVEPVLALCGGMPSHETACAMLNGRWNQWGWSPI